MQFEYDPDDIDQRSYKFRDRPWVSNNKILEFQMHGMAGFLNPESEMLAVA